MLGVYVHLPFCPYICPYCDFAKWKLRAGRAQHYLEALYAELTAHPGKAAATIYFGGGTPNAYDSTTLATLVRDVRDRFPGTHEVSVEINPELVEPGDFIAYRDAGVTRLSIGVQSFEPSEIAALRRRHVPEQIGGVVEAARTAGIASISLDLMFAVPGQTAASWRRSIQRAIALDVDHISTYGLTVEDATPYARWRAREPQAFFDDAAEAELYAIAIELLVAAGYEHYEISNFGRPGHHCAHNLNYWANGEYVGLGVGAASYRDGVRSLNARSLDAYVAAVLRGDAAPSETERLEGRKRVGEAVMLALRTSRGVRLAEFNERYGTDVATEYAPVIARFIETGLLERGGDFMRLTERGRFVANEICGAFVTFD